MPLVAFCSFRFGPTDGVSVVARTWMDTFARAGYDVVTVTGDDAPTGQLQPHRRVPGLGIPEPAGVDAPGPDPDRLHAALADADVVVVENLLTIPLHLPASRAVAAELAGRPALLHHHDPPWQRERFAHVTELPADDPAWRHVAISGSLASQLAERGIRAAVVPNGFEVPTTTPRERSALRARTRRGLGLGPEEPVLVHPVRAIARKDVPAALAVCEQVGGTYWLLGPAEEGYGPELAQLLAAARCRVVHHPAPSTDAIYATADHVLFPSRWEGFGNPPIEAAMHRRTATVGHYPVSDELRALGFRWFEPGDATAVRRVLDDPGAADVQAVLDGNERLAVDRFSLERTRADLRAVLDAAGWLP